MTYLTALEPEMSEAYDQLVDCGETAWLESVRTAVSQRGDIAKDSATSE